eukprot:4841971-Pyramimonas_sp.AAC.2
MLSGGIFLAAGLTHVVPHVLEDADKLFDDNDEVTAISNWLACCPLIGPPANALLACGAEALYPALLPLRVAVKRLKLGLDTDTIELTIETLSETILSLSRGFNSSTDSFRTTYVRVEPHLKRLAHLSERRPTHQPIRPKRATLIILLRPPIYLLTHPPV